MLAAALVRVPPAVAYDTKPSPNQRGSAHPAYGDRRDPVAAGDTVRVTTDDRTALIKQTRHRLASEGPPWTRGRELDFETVTMAERDCDLLRDQLVSERAGTVVEIGLAYGSSALAIGEALARVARPNPRHIIIDPFQESIWSNVGWDLVRAVGLDSIARLVLAPSSTALPQLVTEGFVADAAFVDGSHRFHEVFVDLYFLRKIVRPGGLIVMDDHSKPPVRTAARYFARNLGWTAIPDVFQGGTMRDLDDGPGMNAVPRCMAFRLPDTLSDPPYTDFHPF